MATLFLATMLAASANVAAVQSSHGGIQPNVDAPEQRQALRQLSACLAEHRPRWARQLLDKPYLSNEQASEASQALSGGDRCLGDGEVELTFRTSTMVGSLAEHYVRAELDGVDFDRVTRALATVEPRNVSEDFALCMAAANPRAARTLTMSEFGSDAESTAAAQMGRYVERCSNPNENLIVDVQSLRALTSMAFYRSMERARN